MRPVVLGAPMALLIVAAGPAIPVADAAPKTTRLERAVVKRLNGIRAQNGLPGFRISHKLVKAADAHSSDMVRADFFAHESSNGQSFEQRIQRYTHAHETGETLAYMNARKRGQAKALVSMWMASPGHRQALLTRSFRRIGIAKKTGTLYGQRSAVFTADLSTPR